jgi:hypothetical protein
MNGGHNPGDPPQPGNQVKTVDEESLKAAHEILKVIEYDHR